MFPHAVLFTLCILFSLTSVAQTFRDKTGAPLNNSGSHVLNAPIHRSNTLENARISITRLREPRKAQRVYYKAMDAWRKGHSAEAQRKLDETLKMYPAFPEALTLYGCIHATFQQWDLPNKSFRLPLKPMQLIPPRMSR